MTGFGRRKTEKPGTPLEAIQLRKELLLEKEEISSFVFRLAALLLICLVLFTGFFHIRMLKDNSLEPVFEPREVLLVWLNGEYEKGDYVEVHDENGTWLAKLAASGPDWISESQGHLKVNDAVQTDIETDSFTAVQLEEGQYLAAAVNRSALVNQDQIQGKVIFSFKRLY